jgi:hypothetical protein
VNPPLNEKVSERSVLAFARSPSNSRVIPGSKVFPEKPGYYKIKHIFGKYDLFWNNLVISG